MANTLLAHPHGPMRSPSSNTSDQIPVGFPSPGMLLPPLPAPSVREDWPIRELSDGEESESVHARLARRFAH